ncbi:YciI family protein [Streptomyces tremellae]|uniref:YCII-related domain-containing protein n=1 Tax=Streptomyces tremellae TaxID=1124239 RepID=A0ABP7F1I5_9ACTN
MAVFIVRLQHPDEEGWKRWVKPHVEWIEQQVASGVVVASGPSVGTSVRQGWLVMAANSQSELRSVLETDPFWRHGIVEGLLIVEWDPVFGRLDGFSSSPGGLTAEDLTS